MQVPQGHVMCKTAIETFFLHVLKQHLRYYSDDKCILTVNRSAGGDDRTCEREEDKIHQFHFTTTEQGSV